MTTTFDDTLRFYLNGTRVVLDEIDPEVTLLEYLRGIGLTGTKLYALPHPPPTTSPMPLTIRLQRLRRRRLRCLHRRRLPIQPHHKADLPRERQCLSGAPRLSRRQACHHRRGHRQRQAAPPSPGARRQEQRLAVRLLHTGHRHELVCPAQEQPGADRARYRGGV